VVAQSLHNLLELILQFCAAVKLALAVRELPGNTEAARVDKGKRRLAGEKAMQLAQQFVHTVSSLVVLLGECEGFKYVEGSEITCLLDSIQASAFVELHAQTRRSGC
jgi:hypothetical protein